MRYYIAMLLQVLRTPFLSFFPLWIMKTNTPKTLDVTAALLAATIILNVASVPSAHAATIDWSPAAAGGGAWVTNSNWVGGVGPGDSLTADIARFNQTSYANQPALFATVSVNGLIYGDGVTVTAATSITVGDGAGNLIIGSGGIVMNANAGNASINNGRVKLGASQTWTNNSTNVLTIGSAISNAGSTPVTLSIGGTGAINVTSAIADGGPGGTLAIEVNKTSGTMTFGGTGASSFSGGLIVKSGTAVGSARLNAFGTGAITLGDSSGSADATLGGGANTYANAINVAAGSTGTLSLFGAGGANSTFSGAVTLNNNLTLASNAGTVTLAGGVTGTGNLTLGGTGGNNQIKITNASVDINGTITASGLNTGENIISGGVGSGVTAITLNSTTSALTISTSALHVNSNGTTLTNSAASGGKVLTLSGGTVGTGDLILNNNTATGSAITLSTLMVNHQGAIINSGVGAGSVSIAAAVGSNVTEIRQTSATSALNVSGTISVNSTATTIINNGGAKVDVQSSTGVGDLIIKNNSSTAEGVVFSVGAGRTLNHTGLFTNAGTGSGSVAVKFNIGENVTGVVQDSATSKLVLSGSNSYQGDTVVRAGTLEVANFNALQYSTLDTGVLEGQAVTFVGGGTFYFGGLKGSNALSVGANTFSIGGNNQNTVYSGVLSGGNGKIIKTGTGTLTLTENNTYTGSTTVTAGRLQINTARVAGNSGTGTGAVNVTGGALGGDGIIRVGTNNKITVNSGAYISPGDRRGNTLGTLVLDGGGTTAALLTMDAGAKFSFRLGADFESDHIDFWNYAGSSDFVLNNNVIDIIALNGATEGTYTLFNFYGDSGTDEKPLGFSSSGLVVYFLNGGSGTLEYSYNRINLIVTNIPEPSTWALLGGSMIAVGALRRRTMRVV